MTAGAADRRVELAPDYVEARTRFTRAASGSGATLERHPVPGVRGPAEEELSVDVARLGSAGAPALLFVISGTHGVEGFAGSACQCEWLASGAATRAVAEAGGALAVVLLHAINPYGFAWVRRVNEDNVDLNRNCIEFGGSLPRNPRYDELAADLVPPEWNDETRSETTLHLVAFAAEHGATALQAAISGGQYDHPEGVFYGGTEPVWSRRTLEGIVRAHAMDVARVAVIDLHTGLGPRGVGELICSHRTDAAAFARARSWYGDITSPTGGTSVSVAVTGDLLDAIDRWLPAAQCTGIAIEWGTVSQAEVVHALRGDAWLHAYGDPRGPEASAVKEALREAFAPEDREWAARVWARFAQVVAQAVAGLDVGAAHPEGQTRG